jgi:thiamine pyrophosphate-dependent acetolactate synthase large subunit-like protein
MADGWARVRDEPGVAVVITGPGVTNAMTPLGQARHDGTPLLVVSASVRTDHRGRRLGVIHDLPDQAAMTEAVTRRTIVVEDPADLAAAVDEAWAVLTGRDGPIGPVHLEVPMDVLGRPAADDAAAATPAAPAAPDPAAVAAAVALLADAERPAVILGGGARPAAADALAVAEALGAPIGLTINAKGLVPGDHPLAVPSRMMFAPLDRLFLDADVVLAVGTQLSDLDWWTQPEGFATAAPVIRVDADPAAFGTNAASAIDLLGDAGPAVAALAAAIGGANGDRAARTAALVAEGRAAIAWPDEIARHLPAVDAIDRALPRDRIVAVDSTQLGYAANHALDAHLPGSWLMPIGFGCLGPALPMAIGAKLAAPERPVLAIAGDGGFLFTLGELATAVDQRLPLPVVIWNNDGYGEIRDAMEHARMPALGTDASAADIPAIARGFGCHGLALGDIGELEPAIRGALDADRPTVIEIGPTTKGVHDGT